MPQMLHKQCLYETTNFLEGILNKLTNRDIGFICCTFI